jgi:hypothetical protein
MLGPGKYDAEATAAFEQTEAQGVILIVLGGNRGHGFSAQVTAEAMAAIPALLRAVADQIEADEV